MLILPRMRTTKRLLYATIRIRAEVERVPAGQRPVTRPCGWVYRMTAKSMNKRALLELISISNRLWLSFSPVLVL